VSDAVELHPHQLVRVRARGSRGAAHVDIGRLAVGMVSENGALRPVGDDETPTHWSVLYLSPRAELLEEGDDPAEVYAVVEVARLVPILIDTRPYIAGDLGEASARLVADVLECAVLGGDPRARGTVIDALAGVRPELHAYILARMGDGVPPGHPGPVGLTELLPTMIAASGTDCALSRAVFQRLGGHARLLTMDGVLHRYDESIGTWRNVEGVVNQLLSTWPGTWWVDRVRGGAAARPILMGQNMRRTVLAELRLLATREDWQTLPGVAFSDCFVHLAEDGTIDVREHSPLHYAQHSTGVSWDPDATSPTLARFGLELCGGDAEAWDIILRLFGAALLGQATRLDRSLWLYGCRGGEGKSTLLSSFESLFPSGSVSYLPPEKMSEPYFAAGLAGKLLNCIPESSAAHITESAAAAFKGAVTGDPLPARVPYGQVFTVTPRALWAIALNDFPSVADASGGWKRRVVAVDTRPVDWGFFGSRAQVKETLLAEKQGVLTMLVYAAGRAFHEGIPASDGVKTASESWHEEANTMSAFLNECLRPCPAPVLPAAEAYACYKAFAAATAPNAPIQKQGHFGRKLREYITREFGESEPKVKRGTILYKARVVHPNHWNVKLGPRRPGDASDPRGFVMDAWAPEDGPVLSNVVPIRPGPPPEQRPASTSQPLPPVEPPDESSFAVSAGRTWDDVGYIDFNDEDDPDAGRIDLD
jgi:P4 family phage/plasmid primase-like protien